MGSEKGVTTGAGTRGPVSMKGWERAGVILLCLLAAWLYWRVPLAVPPGLEMDELIEAEIADQVLQGDWRPFYSAGQGREGLYYYWLAGWLSLTGRHLLTLRLASTTLSLLGLAATYALVRRLFGPPVALLSLAYGATTFWLLLAARSGLRSTSLPLLAALAGTCFWRGLTQPQPEGERGRFGRLADPALPWLAAAGALLGLSFYAYTAARVLPLLFFLFILYLFCFHRARLAGRLPALLVGAALALLVMLPLLSYLRLHPESDEFAFMDFNRPLAALESGDPQPALQTSLATLKMFTFQGDPLIFDNVPGRPVFDPASSLLFLAGAGLALWRWRRPAYAFALLWLLVTLIPGMLSQPAPNFYRTTGAQVMTFVFPALALARLGRFARDRTFLRLPGAALPSALALILLGVQLVGTWQAYFTIWPRVDGISFFWQRGLVEAAGYLSSAAEEEPVALCTDLTYEYDPWWRPAWQSMTYLMPRSSLHLRYYDCRTTLILPPQRPVRYLFPNTAEPEVLLPPEFRGEWLAQARHLPAAFSAGQGVALEVDGLLPAPEVGLDEVSWAPEAGGGAASLPLRFGDSLELLGYGYSARGRPGEFLRLVTSWRVVQQPPPRLALFTHILAAPEALLSQQDSLALTSQSLRPGDRFWVLHHEIPLPPEAATQPLLVSIGLYSRDTMERLPLFQGETRRGDRLFLQPLSPEG